MQSSQTIRSQWRSSKQARKTAEHNDAAGFVSLFFKGESGDSPLLFMGSVHLPYPVMMNTNDTPVLVRKATENDASVILSLVDALAAYEKLDPPDARAKERLIKDMSGEHPRFDAYLADVGGKGAGYAFVFETYSSFLALPTLYLEDLFVLPEYRQKKIGLALFSAMVKEAHRRGCGRMEWTVLDWNQIAIDFYKRLGATHLRQWHLYRLTQREIAGIAGATPP